MLYLKFVKIWPFIENCNFSSFKFETRLFKRKFRNYEPGY